MAPRKALKATIGTKAPTGTLYDHFKPIRRRGRPKKRHDLAKDVAKSMKKTLPADAVAVLPPPPKPKASTKTNWGAPHMLPLMSKAINEWKGKSGRALDSNGEAIEKLSVFARKVHIPYETLRKYLSNDRKLGASMGRKILINPQDQSFIIDNLARKDRGNEGATPAEAIDLVLEVNPELSRKQASQCMNRSVLPKHPDKIKRKPRKAQATTTKRCNINVQQQ